MQHSVLPFGSNVHPTANRAQACTVTASFGSSASSFLKSPGKGRSTMTITRSPGCFEGCVWLPSPRKVTRMPACQPGRTGRDTGLHSVYGWPPGPRRVRSTTTRLDAPSWSSASEHWTSISMGFSASLGDKLGAKPSSSCSYAAASGLASAKNWANMLKGSPTYWYGSKPEPAGGNFSPRSPSSSYVFRRSGSISTSYASAMSRKRCSASALEPGFFCGCHFMAAQR
mmetsp:Transcript_13448/g.37214  ORF Transcript_13448/g.37214 Transcript_13448/m.37214 type:complete len:227 (+) Transcript_13448:60-740(+)